MDNQNSQSPAIPQEPAPAAQPMQSVTSLPTLPNNPTSTTSPIRKHHHFPFHKILLALVVILVIIFSIAYAGTYYVLNKQLDKLTHQGQAQTPTSQTPQITPTTPITPTIPTAVVCTQEAKQCLNGSYVSRTGPNCEFAACPN